MSKKTICYVLCSLLVYTPTLSPDPETPSQPTQPTRIISEKHVEKVEIPVLLPVPIVLEKQAEEVETPVEQPNDEPISMGKHKLTAYCCENYPHICNNGDSSATATGTTPTPGRTIAVDPSQIPYGSEVIINGCTYIAEDCGGAIRGNRVDILVETHKEALEFGVQYAEVFLKNH